jgi:hypothetical protein
MTTFRKVVCILIGCSIVLIFAWPRESLEKYGVTYKVTTGQSPTFYHVQIQREVGGVVRTGPEIIGSVLSVRYEDLTGDGIPEMIVYSESSKENEVHLQLVTEPGSAFDFRVLRQSYLYIHYPEQGYIWP